MPGSRHRNALPSGHMLLWYRIEEILGQGGFGITYLARDTKIDQIVAIKEYLPIDLATRASDDSIQPVADDREELFAWGLTRFLDEARTLALFKHPNIVRVLFYTEANNTGYMIMEYEQGESLESVLRRGETFDEQRLRGIAEPLLDGLAVIHKAGFIHRDIKPANIYLRSNGSPVLLDFGSARQSFAGQTRTLTTLVSPGYAPFEQYHGSGENQGPWTDLYALGATLYRMATGKPPADAIARSAGLQDHSDPVASATGLVAERYSAEILAAIDKALAFRASDRPQSVAEMQLIMQRGAVPTPDPVSVDPDAPTMILGQGEAVTVANPTADGRSGTSGNRRWLLIAGIVIGLAMVLLAIRPERPPAEPATQRSSPATAAGDKVADLAPRRLISAPEPKTIDELLRLAQADLEAMHLTRPPGDNALERYREILSREPRNRQAVRGLQRIAARYGKLAERAVDKQQYAQALEYLERAASLLDEDLPRDLTDGLKYQQLAQQIRRSRDRLKKAIKQQQKSH